MTNNPTDWTLPARHDELYDGTPGPVRKVEIAKEVGDFDNPTPETRSEFYRRIDQESGSREKYLQEKLARIAELRDELDQEEITTKAELQTLQEEGAQL